ncbi:T9SS type A sorting domain-containing protein [Thalassobellus citreus]|uniref:T9SS type A sorting domain-containing protein n=1 Tax=Thalassobellus citreus TaxID=3367752 RepID=UPI0037A906C7
MKKFTLTICLLLLSITSVFAQNDNPIVFEAESGTFSATTDYETITEGGVTYVQPKTDKLSGDYPGSDDKVITYSATFPDAGTYDLFAKVYVGSGAGSNDSFFTAATFGAQTTTDAASWIKINETNFHGYTEPTDAVDGASNAEIDTKNEVWKWINISKMTRAESQTTYTVAANNSTFDFQVGARELGLRFDKFAFGKSSLTYTVADLDAGVLSIKKNTLKSVKVYPNPSSNGFNIETTEQSVSYKIFNLLGAKVEEGVLSLGVNKYGNSLKSGTYILDLQSNNKRNVMKIVKY